MRHSGKEDRSENKTNLGVFEFGIQREQDVERLDAVLIYWNVQGSYKNPLKFYRKFINEKSSCNK